VGPLALPEALLVGAALVAVAAWLGAGGLLLDLALAAVVLGLLGVTASSLQWAMARATPGANDNASAVAAMLTCAEKLLPELPEDVELQLVGTGAEEVGCCGMRGFVEQHDWHPEGTYFVNFECVGGGLLHYICSEGVLRKVHFPPVLLELARRVAGGGAFGEVTPTHLLASTDGHVPAELGYASLSLISLDPDGVPLHYHRIEDTVDGIDTATVVRAADFGAAVVMAALRDEAGPIAAVAP
jgi:Zn-dependent M28 family amino/carboxypeptidase